MIDRKTYDFLKERFGAVASWAIWAPSGDTVKSNTGDMSVFDDESVLKSPMSKWSKFWFVFDGDTVYLVNNEDIDSVDEVKSTTKYFCGNTVTYKITPTV